MTSLFFEERYQARRSYRKSCDRCHASKLKCASINQLDPFSECTRCNKAHLPCSYSPRCAKLPILPHSDVSGERPEHHNADAIPATTSHAMRNTRSPVYTFGTGATAGHSTETSSSSVSASSTDLDTALSRGSDQSSPYDGSTCLSRSNVPVAPDYTNCLSATTSHMSIALQSDSPLRTSLPWLLSPNRRK